MSSPLSLTQHAVWLSEQLDPGTSAYHIAELYSLAGSLQPAILEQAFSEIIRRHEALRTVFKLEHDQPVQVIHSPSRFELPVIDLSRLSEAEREYATDKQIQEEVARAFDLTTGPLLRPTLIKLDDERHLLLIVTHHLVCDGWSLGVLIQELKQLYTAFLRGESDPLPKLPMQYADFVKWQRGEEMERHLDYWRRRLAGVP
ncbi:MAG TPA: condensation domain-containing protein, partial [Pyrinomonadaceae bacterium]|nr:condensation domain-containing protein [Pyrinomonadaceae bacterium]